MAGESTILLVIDDPTFRGGLMVALRNRGMRPVMTGDGEQANAFLAKETPALVIVDARIPGEGGIPWIRSQRELGSRVPMVLCAASREEAKALTNLAQQLYISSVIPKAAAADAIATHVAELLGPAEPEPSQPAVADAGQALAVAVEALRVAMVNLQKDAERRERVDFAYAAAEKLLALAKPVGHEPSIAVATRILAMLDEVRNARLRLGPDTFTQSDKLLQRARESLPVPIAGRAGPTPPPRIGPTPPPMAVPIAPPASPTASARRPSSFIEVDAKGPSAVPPNTDELTGLLTRDAFLAEAQERVDGAMVDGRPLSVCVIGVDGAAVLRAARTLDPILETLGKFLATRFRPDVDVRGRWILDGFAVVFPGTPATMAVSNMVRTLEAFGALKVAAQGGQPVKLNVGVASYPKDGRDAAQALQVAERRMDEARKAGGGAVKGP